MSSNDNFMEFGFGQGDEGFKNKKTRYKGKENRTDRLSFVWWPLDENDKPDLDADSPRFVGAPRVYIKGVGYVLYKGPEYGKYADGGSGPKKSVATIVIQWPTDDSGNLDKSRFTTGFRVLSWTFSKIRYDSLSRSHSQFPLGSHDVMFSCEDTQFQKGSMTPCRESLFRKIMEKEGADEIQAKIMSQIKEVEANIQGELARDLTLEQIREKLGVENTSLQGVVAADTEAVDDMLDNLGV